MKVSVVTPNYNGLKFLNNYFETLLIQSRFIEEIILIDNASTDGSYELLEKYADIIALGTIADIVSLKGENRILVRCGVAFINLAISNGTLREGLKALFDESASAGPVDASSLAFRIGPRINAAGRMGSAERALKLLLTEDATEAKAIAEEISRANAERQETESGITEAAIRYACNGVTHSSCNRKWKYK